MSSRRLTRLAKLTLGVSLLGALVVSASAQAATLPTLSLAVTKTAVTVTGAKESGAANVVVTDTGIKEAGVILFLIKPNVTVTEVEAFLAKKGAASDPNNTAKYGSIVYSVEAQAGKSVEAQSYLKPGQYMALVPAEGAASQPHTFFTVTAAASPLALPTPGATERTIEFAFRGPTTLRDGELVTFENEGFLVHMDLAFPVKNMQSAKLAVKYLKAGREKAAGKLITGQPVAFAGPVSHEAAQQETITAKPGIYVQVCFMETQDGRDHTTLGMERIIKIAK